MPYTLKQFRKEHTELKGKKIILCEHLRNKSIDEVDINLFIGDSTRLLLCPICRKVHTQTAWEYILSTCVFAIDVTKKFEYSQWMETAGKEKS